MDIRPIRNEDDLTQALTRLDAIWGAAPETPEGDELDVLTVLIEDYETRQFPLATLNPIAFLKAHMEATGRTQSDLAALLGSASRASEILNRRRALTVEMIHRLSTAWQIPAQCLVQPYELAA